MFDASIKKVQLDLDGEPSSKMIVDLWKRFAIENISQTGEITSMNDFLDLHRITSDFYRSATTEIYEDYIPLYHSIWRHPLGASARSSNIHQDGGVQYFTKHGYQARMVNTWLCIEKPEVGGASDDLGLFVIDNAALENKIIYDKLATSKIHAIGKDDRRLVDNTHVAGPVIKYDLSTLKRTTFPYEAGTMIMFSSHLLHGTKYSYEGPIRDVAPNRSGLYRTALTSVWLHRDHFNWDVLEWSEAEYEKLYLWRHSESMWGELKLVFKEHCDLESFRIAKIVELAKMHLHTSA